MNRETYELVENYMLSSMKDSAHDKDHVYRVLYTALDIAEYENSVDYDVLVTACLLHDIGRQEQFECAELCHAAVGAQKAREFLLTHGFSTTFAEKVKVCIQTHRFRSDMPPESVEAKILFDADKIDVTGTIGIARTIFYQGQVSEPLYTLLPDGQVSDGTNDTAPSFFREYKFKLEGMYAKLYTGRGKAIAAQRQTAAAAFYNSMVQEVESAYKTGHQRLCEVLAK
jgi:uncharacterized protein